MEAMKGKSVAFRPRAELRARPDKLARATGRPITWLIEKCIEAHVPVLEVKYDKEIREHGPATRTGRYPLHSAEFSTAEDSEISSAAQAVEKEAIREIRERFPKRGRPPKAGPAKTPNPPG